MVKSTPGYACNSANIEVRHCELWAPICEQNESRTMTTLRLRTALSQYVSNVCLPLGPFGTRTVHFPPCSHLGSSHFGSIPFLNRWKSAPDPTQLGGLMLLYKLHIQGMGESSRSGLRTSIINNLKTMCVATHHQKSSTVSKVYTDRKLEPQLSCFCLPLGLSNQSVHLCSRACLSVVALLSLVEGISPSSR